MEFAKSDLSEVLASLTYFEKLPFYHGGPIRPQNHLQSRKHTWSDQIAMKLAGEVKWVLLRVCKLFLFNIINIFVINLTF